MNKTTNLNVDTRKRSSSTAASEIIDQPPTKQNRHENLREPSRTPKTWRPRCVFMVEHIRKHHLQFHNRNTAEGEKRNCGMFVSLADANCRVRDVMEDVIGEFWLSNEQGEDSIFREGGDQYYGNPGNDGETVGSLWEFDDWHSDVTHKVYVRAYPLTWPMHSDGSNIHRRDGLDQSKVRELRIDIDEMEWIGV
ncbi:hypothetical protein J7T55_003342 [Diaporthe amygdali]|uniref:uncharacterized protein n=1 Tax=Phomopsis amygdali TaxID=1214568 RepID=UPI0022FDF9BB|nr:uncharacterized protein J7T55_003342 [Diaporthe amygdali]KAJ0116928.1 hypothetical protein J7T55_003342 [Diaporthe amygdali]